MYKMLSRYIKRLFSSCPFLIFANTVIVGGLLTWLLISVLYINPNYEENIQKEWIEVIDTIPKSSNQAAIELEYLLAKLGLGRLTSVNTSKSDIVSSEPDLIRAEHSDSWEAVRDHVSNYIELQEEKTNDGIEPIPEDLKDYLRLHKSQIDSIVKHINDSEVPTWGIDYLNKYQLPDYTVSVPSFLNLVDIQRLLVLNALGYSQNQQDEEAMKALSASLKLTFAIAQRPELIAQLVSVIGINIHAKVIQNLHALSYTWINGIDIPDLQERMFHSLKFEAFSHAGTFGENTISGMNIIFEEEFFDEESSGAPFSLLQRIFQQPFLRLASMVNFQKAMQDIRLLSNSSRLDLCPLNTDLLQISISPVQIAWNPLPNFSLFYNQYNKVNKALLRWELARKIVRIKEISAALNSFPDAIPDIEKSEYCPTLSWHYRLAVYRPHDHIDAAKNSHNVGHLHPFQQVGQNLQVVEIGRTNLKPPGKDIVVAHNKDPQFTLAAF
jgi:hypothetical protein